MTNLAAKRIQYELRDVIRSEEVTQCGIKVEMIDGSIYDLKGEIKGPPDTPYEGGTFELEIKIPERYPFDPPNVRFVTKIWHVNISYVTGEVCLDILGHQWSAVHTLRTILLSLQGLLESPEPDDPQVHVISGQMRENPEMVKSTARHWTNVYAGGPTKNESFDEKIRKIVKLGFLYDDVLDVISTMNWNLNAAMNTIKAKYGR